MSRSYRKPFATPCKKSAGDKKYLSKKRRAMEKDALQKGRALPQRNQEILSLWEMQQDGGNMYCPGEEKLTRK